MYCLSYSNIIVVDLLLCFGDFHNISKKITELLGRLQRTTFILYICSNVFMNLLNLFGECTHSAQIGSCLHSTRQLINIWRQPRLSKGFIDYLCKSLINSRLSSQPACQSTLLWRWPSPPKKALKR